MPADPGDVQARLEELRKAFLAHLPDRMRELDKVWQQLDGGQWTAESFQEFHRGIHALSGSAAMYGNGALSDCARVLEAVLKRLGDGEKPPDRRTAELIAGGLKEMRRAAKRPRKA
jgi:chemotaxis protein histidine kinase CheA